MQPRPEEVVVPAVKQGRHHAHAVKPGNGRRSPKKRQRVRLVPGVMLNGKPFGFVA